MTVRSADGRVIVMPLTIDIMIVSKKERFVSREIFQQFRRDNIVDNDNISSSDQFVFRGKLCDRIKSSGKFLLIASAVFCIKTVNPAVVAAEKFSTFLHVPLNAADNAVIFADVNDIHNSPR